LWVRLLHFSSGLCERSLSGAERRRLHCKRLREDGIDLLFGYRLLLAQVHKRQVSLLSVRTQRTCRPLRLQCRLLLGRVQERPMHLPARGLECPRYLERSRHMLLHLGSKWQVYLCRCFPVGRRVEHALPLGHRLLRRLVRTRRRWRRRPVQVRSCRRTLRGARSVLQRVLQRRKLRITPARTTQRAQRVARL